MTALLISAPAFGQDKCRDVFSAREKKTWLHFKAVPETEYLGEVVTPDYPIPVFTYTVAENITNPAAFIQAKIKDSYAKNEVLVNQNSGRPDTEEARDLVPHNQAMGYGHYFSSDPLESYHLGKTLVVAMIPPKTRLYRYSQVTLSTRIRDSWSKAVMGSQGGVVHAWDTDLSTDMRLMIDAVAVMFKETDPSGRISGIDLGPSQSMAISKAMSTVQVADFPKYRRQDFQTDQGQFDVLKYFRVYGSLFPVILGPLNHDFGIPGHGSINLAKELMIARGSLEFAEKAPWVDANGQLYDLAYRELVKKTGLPDSPDTRSLAESFFAATWDMHVWVWKNGLRQVYYPNAPTGNKENNRGI